MGSDLRDYAAARGGLPAIGAGERLRLATALCEAVAALHAGGQVHRHLAPGSVHPVADPAAPGGIRVRLSPPAPADAPLSPPYLAPEVAAGEAHTQRSDVFALGVLTYQLVVGDLQRSLAPGWEADVGDPLLCEDIQLACAANPDRRVLDARGLSARLATLPDRHRAFEADLARQEAERDRERQAIRERGRRRVMLAVSIALAAGLAGTTAMYFAAESARQRAELAAVERQAVLDFVTGDILGQADPYRNAQAHASLPLLEAVDRAAEHVDARLSDPAAAAAVHTLVANVYFAQDRHADAIAEYDRARALYRGLGADHLDALVVVETGLCDVHRIAGDLATAQEECQAAWRHAEAAGGDVRDVATLKLGQLRGEQGADQASLALLRPLLEAGAFADQPRLRGELHWALGLAERGLGRYDAAREQFTELLAINRRDGASDTWTAWALNSLGSILVSTGQYDAAETQLLEARRLFQASQGAGVEAQMPNIWRGEIRLRRGEWDEAIAMQRALIDAWRPTLQPGHPLLLKAEANLGWALAEAGRDDEARAALDEVLEARAETFERPGDGVAVRAMRWTRAALALDDDAATQALLAIVDSALEQEFPEHHPVTAEALCLHARAALRHEDLAGAREQAGACAAMLRAFVGDAHPLAVEARGLLAAAGG